MTAILRDEPAHGGEQGVERGWSEGGVNSLEWDEGLVMSIINFISLQTQQLLTSSGLIKGVTWTHTSNTWGVASLSTYGLTQSSLVVTGSPLMINWSLSNQKLISVSVRKPLWNCSYSHRGTQSHTSPGCLFRYCDFPQVKWDVAKKNYCVKVMTQEKHSDPLKHAESQKEQII